ncbi:O-antigen ligase family protein [Candidatus Gottesmanbacteria bacterium]|nr:O-antigen ligase family protein [Candidatus Gottesmanbacteria bacterium]
MANTKPTAQNIIILYYLLLAILILFPFGQLTQIPFFPGPRVYLHDILVGLVWVFLLFHYQQIKNISKNILFFPSILFIFIALLSLIISLLSIPGREVFVGSLYLLRWIGYLTVALATILVVKRKPEFKQKIIKTLIFTGSAASIFGLAQYIFYPDLRNLYYLGWDPHYLRIFGTFFDPNFLGLVIVLTIIMTITSLNNSWLKYSLFFLNTLTLALTYSRSSFIALAGSLISLFFYRKFNKTIVFIFIIGLVTLLFLPKGPQSEGIQLERMASVEGRVESINKGISLFFKSPLFGVGFNNLRSYQKIHPQDFRGDTIPENAAGGIENSFIFLLATTGIAGFTAYMILLVGMFMVGDRILKISLIAILVHSLFNNSLFYPWVMLWIWILVGVSSKQDARPARNATHSVAGGR